jgi:hypothetical protein
MLAAAIQDVIWIWIEPVLFSQWIENGIYFQAYKTRLAIPNDASRPPLRPSGLGCQNAPSIYLLKYMNAESTSKATVRTQSEESLIAVFLAMRGF